MNEQEHQQRNMKSVAGIREAIARFADQLRSEGLPETEIHLILTDSSIDVVRKMSAMSTDEEVSPELYHAISTVISDVMSRPQP